MRVFLSWSTPTSRAVAEALRDWLPNVVQEVEPWLSAADITPGVRWPLEVGRHLEASDFGVLCLTAGNLSAPWILFEAGALGKKLETARVVPYLFRVQREAVTGPLSQFQNVESSEEGTRGMVGAIHSAITSSALTPERLSRAFDKWWPELDERLRAIQEHPTPDPTPERNESDVLAEVLSIVRGLQRDATASAPASVNPRPGLKAVGSFAVPPANLATLATAMMDESALATGLRGYAPNDFQSALLQRASEVVEQVKGKRGAKRPAQVDVDGWTP